jgi:hypothetical protein
MPVAARVVERSVPAKEGTLDLLRRYNQSHEPGSSTPNTVACGRGGGVKAAGAAGARRARP